MTDAAPFHWEPLTAKPIEIPLPAALPPWANSAPWLSATPEPFPLPPPGAPFPPPSTLVHKPPIPDVTPRWAPTLNRSDRAPLSLDGPDPEWDACINGAEPCGLPEANILTSEAQGRPGIHKFMIDIDLPLVAIPSSQPGHWHLYIDVDIEWERYVALLRALALAGVIEVGYARASIKRGYTSLRPPWLPKRPEEYGGNSS